MSVSTLAPPQQHTRTAAATGSGLSMFDAVDLGLDEFGHRALVPLMFRNILIGGEPGSGKSGLLNVIVAHAALSLDCRLVLMDGKQVELGQWLACADVFVGPDFGKAIRTLMRLQTVMNNRYAYLVACERRKITPDDAFTAVLLAIDEIAFYSATAGDKKNQELFAVLLRDLVARGRAVGIIVVAATQRPSSDIIPTSLRDLFAWRWAGRCTTDSSSDIVLGHGWANKGWTANSISPTAQGTGLLIAEGGTPKLIKAAYLSDVDCYRIAAHAARLRTAAKERGA
jgi:DNA segregation ATPase FtsK/SpoIIIE, S-DNA-T family